MTKKYSPEAFAALFDEHSNESRHIACRYCGLVGREGCDHLVANCTRFAQIAVPVRRLGGVPSHLLPPEVETRTFVRVNPNGQPVRDQSFTLTQLQSLQEQAARHMNPNPKEL